MQGNYQGRTGSPGIALSARVRVKHVPSNEAIRYARRGAKAWVCVDWGAGAVSGDLFQLAGRAVVAAVIVRYYSVSEDVKGQAP